MPARDAPQPPFAAGSHIGTDAGPLPASVTVILNDILAKLPALTAMRDLVVLGVSPGCADLPRRLIEVCRQRGHGIVLLDAPETLAQLPDVDEVTVKLTGRFPSDVQAIRRAVGDEGADVCLGYGVLHHLFRDGNPFDVIDATVQLLARGGKALFGDIPNHSRRRRFFASPAGLAFHKRFARTSGSHMAFYSEVAPAKIDDAVLAGLMQQAQAAGCDAYLLPQGDTLPLADRHDDLLISRP